MSKPNRIREWRERRDMTLEQLAELAGISVSYLSRLENGGRNVSIKTMDKLVGPLRVKVSDLVPDQGGQDEDPLLYKGALRNNDCIQVSVGYLRDLIVEAMADVGLDQEKGEAFADAILELIEAQQDERPLARLVVLPRSETGLAEPKPVGP